MFILTKSSILINCRGPTIYGNTGFPIYGPKGPGGQDMRHGGNEKGTSTLLGPCTGGYCMDECNGVEALLPAVDPSAYK